MAPYFLKLDQFEGPLDLLLHLIRLNEIDIFNIDIFILTDQYVNYLRVVGFDDLNHAGEFLEMASTLLELKTKMLLPAEKRKGAEVDQEENEDPKKSLEQRLLEYEKLRTAASTLGERQVLEKKFWTSQEWRRLEPQFNHLESPLTGDPVSLVILYEQLLKDLAQRKPPKKVEATTHLVTVEEKILEIQAILETARFALFQGFYQSFSSRYELVVNILAVLELVRWNKAKLYQQHVNGPLWIYHIDMSEETLPVIPKIKEQLTKDSDLPGDIP